MNNDDFYKQFERNVLHGTRKLLTVIFIIYFAKSFLSQDVHEIKSGIDWQDSLNYAVSNCEVFVPLITSRYGETQWTNREVWTFCIFFTAVLFMIWGRSWCFILGKW